MNDKRQNLHGIAILLLVILQMLTQIKMNSYVRDMNSLWGSQMELNRAMSNHLQLISDFHQQFAEAIQCNKR